ncbi:MAG: Hsp20/alpha crystallin family protein [Candidatus Atribacteria bacterium]|nr:Hsp20/alpha crystallin family protein [Candidatus Atribacteria bacterium]
MDMIRWEPRDQFIRSFFDDFFDLMERSEGRRSRRKSREEERVWLPATDLIDQKDKLIARIDLPGVDKKDLKISISNNNLTVEGEIEKDKDVKREDYYYSERAYGKYIRTISLPIGVDKNKIKAKYSNGILEIILPKVEEKPKEIKIEAS